MIEEIKVGYRLIIEEINYTLKSLPYLYILKFLISTIWLPVCMVIFNRELLSLEAVPLLFVFCILSILSSLIIFVVFNFILDKFNNFKESIQEKIKQDKLEKEQRERDRILLCRDNASWKIIKEYNNSKKIKTKKKKIIKKTQEIKPDITTNKLQTIE